MAKPEKNFTTALGTALYFETILIVILGALSYTAHGQFTNDVILMNLHESLSTYTV
jgi:hypothetical protein